MSRHHAHIPSRVWERVRRQVLDRDRHRCQMCGRAGLLEVHHLVALDDGGAALDPDNLVSWCPPCHIEHHRPDVSPERQAWIDSVAALEAATEADAMHQSSIDLE